MGDILDRIDWDHYRRTSNNIFNSDPAPIHQESEQEFVKFCQMIDAFNRHDDWLIMKQRCKRLSAESKQRGVDAVCW